MSNLSLEFSGLKSEKNMNNNLFTLKYWFTMNAGSSEPLAQKGFIVFLILLFGLAIYARLKKKGKGIYFRVWNRLTSFASTNVIIGLFLLFFTYEGVLFLSIRFWFLIWLAGMIFWLQVIYKDFKKIPELREKRQQEEKFKKYLP